MSNSISEKKVLQKLDIQDFRYLTKDKVIKMASMLDRMDPEVAKKAIEQFPEFANTTKELLSEYKDYLEKGLESNNKSVTKVYDTYSGIIQSLQKELDKDNLSFEEKKYIIEQMKEIADKVDKKDTENKKFLAGMATLATVVVGGAIAVVATVIGGNTQIETNDLSDIIR